LILPVGVRVRLSDADIAEIGSLRDVAMATNFMTKIPVTSFM